VPQLSDAGLGTDVDVIEGGASFTVDGEPFFSPMPQWEPYTDRSGTDWIIFRLVDWCTTEWGLGVWSPPVIEPGIAEVEAGRVSLNRFNGTPYDFSDDDLWFGVSGRVELPPFDGDGLLEGWQLEPIEMQRAHIDPVTGDVTLDANDTLSLDDLEWAVWMGGDY